MADSPVREPSANGEVGRLRSRRSRLFLHPVALVFLLVILLAGAPRDAVGAALLTVLLLCGVKDHFVDLLRVLGQVVLHNARKLVIILYGTPLSFRCSPLSLE
jgi:hypothetical protein